MARLLLVALLLSAGLVAGAALARGASGAADPAAGAKVFARAGCGACHTLARARAIGKVGPSLDRLKPTAARVSRQVVAGGGGMPSFRGRLSAAQVADVAAFVAAATHGKPTGKLVRPAQDGRSLFRATCGGCHTLAAAGTTGTRGPDLDDERPDLAKVAKQILEGDPPEMPSFARSLTATQISAIAVYVAASVGR